MQNQIPLDQELKEKLQQLTPQQLAFLAGYAWAKSEQQTTQATANPENIEQPPQIAAKRRLTILTGSQTGNARNLGKKLLAQLESQNIEASHHAIGDYKAKTLTQEEDLILITSTQGDGEPPEEALSFYKHLNGKKRPNLSQLRYAVLGLGDKSYPLFCQAGKDFDRLLEECGAKRITPLEECDLDYEAQADNWIKNITTQLKNEQQTTTSPKNKTTPSTNTPSTHYDKNNPCTAQILSQQKITAREAIKDVRHIEIDLEGTGLHYQAGDALGVLPINAPALVSEILELHGLQGTETITIKDKTLNLKEALSEHLEINTSTPQLLKDYANHAQSEALNAVLNHPNISQFLAQNPPIALFHTYPCTLDAQSLVNLFRPLSPRLYSIASSQEEVGEEVHLCVGVIRFEHQDKAYTGTASGYLSDTLQEGDNIRIFVEENPRFRLPENDDTPIIMIGAGTGIAPFRAFMQQRAARNAQGKNWLIFGNTRFTQDFLYQAEWLAWRDEGLLTRADLAWSRDQAQKIYVQDKILESGETLWEYLNQGAHIYICGDASRMAKAVENALLKTIAKYGNFSEEEAEEYLDNLRDNARYQRDVY